MTVSISINAKGKKFIRQLAELSGQNVSLCMQCGYCSGICPMKGSMDILPRRVVRMAQLGLSDRLLDVNMYWVCASCQNCGVICPRGIDLPRVMEALRLIILRKNINHIEPSDTAVEGYHECPQIALVAAFRKSTS